MRNLRFILWLLFFSITAFSQIENLSVDEFLKKVDNEKVVLVYFHADWCVPCVRVKPSIQQLKNEEKEAEILEIDVDKNPKVALHFEINTLPLFIIYKNGKKLWEYNAYMSKSDISIQLSLYKEKTKSK